jgi:hypothetical protein
MATTSNPIPAAAPPHFLADVYTFNWSELNWQLPLVSASAVALCLFTGIFLGHPGGALLAGGGALTVGFGANQRIADSRLIPMLFAVFSTSTASLIGSVAGHSSYVLLVAAALSAFIYGILTTRNTGLSWVGQQASVALLVSSAFPSNLRLALTRAGLIALGSLVQLIVTSIGLRLIPSLDNDILASRTSLYASLEQQRRDILSSLYELPQSLPALSRDAALGYSLRLVLTISIATEIYHHLDIQSGYWIPMTALLVQKPAFFETLSRASARVLGTILGAWLCSLLIAQVVPSPWVLAAFTTLFALLAFATNAVNYALFTASLTSYIVFLLSLNQIPGSVIAHRRAWCTALGAAVALLIHLDALRRHHRASTTVL